MNHQRLGSFDFYWEPTLPKIVFARHEAYSDTLFVYTNSDSSVEFDNASLTNNWLHLVDVLEPYTAVVSTEEEATVLLDSTTDLEQETYLKFLKSHGVDSYTIYSVILCEKATQEISRFLIKVFFYTKVMNGKSKPEVVNYLNSCIKVINMMINTNMSDLSEENIMMDVPTSKSESSLVNKFNIHDESNEDRLTLYIILRNDLKRSVAEQMCDVAQLTKKIWDISPCEFCWSGQTVILEAGYDDLFVNNFIPSKPEDQNFFFTKLIESETRVAHGNFRLQEAAIVGLAYLGIKRDIPKFVKRLALWRK